MLSEEEQEVLKRYQGFCVSYYNSRHQVEKNMGIVRSFSELAASHEGSWSLCICTNYKFGDRSRTTKADPEVGYSYPFEECGLGGIEGSGLDLQTLVQKLLQIDINKNDVAHRARVIGEDFYTTMHENHVFSEVELNIHFPPEKDAMFTYSRETGKIIAVIEKMAESLIIMSNMKAEHPQLAVDMFDMEHDAKTAIGRGRL